MSDQCTSNKEILPAVVAGQSLFRRMGIKFEEGVPGYPGFVHVELRNHWYIETVDSTEYSRHPRHKIEVRFLMDGCGRKRALLTHLHLASKFAWVCGAVPMTHVSVATSLRKGYHIENVDGTEYSGVPCKTVEVKFLVDRRGRKRALLTYLYLAERQAWVCGAAPLTRISVAAWKDGDSGCAEARDGDVTLFSAASPYINEEDSGEQFLNKARIRASEQVLLWLNEHYPKYQDPRAYWQQAKLHADKV